MPTINSKLYTMRKSYFMTCIMICLLTAGFSQPEKVRFGRVSDEEMDMKYYDPDPSAEALIIFDYGTTELSYNEKKGHFEIRYTRHIRIKVFTKDGLDWADFKIPLHSSGTLSENLGRLRGFTFNKVNGKTEREKLNTSDVIEEVSSSSLKYKVFTMPRVTEGSVLDVHYEISSDYLFELVGWSFQHTIPCLNSVYQTIIPEYYNYRNTVSGYENVLVEKSSANRNILYSYRTTARGGMGSTESRREQGSLQYSVDITKYTADNIPALPNEAFVDNRRNYTTRVDFELLSYRFPDGTQRQFSTNWDNIVRELLDHSNFGGQLSGTRYIRDDIQKQIEEIQDSEEQLIAVFRFIRSKISWNERHRMFTNRGARQAYREGRGNSAEVNINLINALRELGFDATPVVLSTRSNGRILPHQVTYSGFNHVIALVRAGGKQYLMDATSDFPDPFVLPTQCLNGKGRIVDIAANNWIDLDQLPVSRSITIINSSITNNNQFTGSVNTLHSGYTAVGKYSQNKTESRREDFVKDLQKRFENAEIELENAEMDPNSRNQFASVFSFTNDESAAFAGDMVYINPTVGFEFDLNPFRQHIRKLPVNFTYPVDIQYSNRITIPEGYAIEGLPDNLNIALPDGDCRFLFSSSMMNNEAVINARLMINRIIYAPEEYQSLKAFFDAVIKKQEEKLILNKI